MIVNEKANGAFGPSGHHHTDLAWNYPAVHALVLLHEAVPRPEDCFRNGRGAIYKQPGSHNANWAWDIYQRAGLAAALGREVEKGLDLKGSWTHEYKDRKGHYYFGIPDSKLRSRVALFCDVPTLAYFVEAIALSGGRIENPEVAREYLLARQLDSGAFVDAYRVEDVVEQDAHVVATAQAVSVLQALGFEVPRLMACAQWLQSCQEDSGGFRWNPSNPATSNRSDVWYTWAASRALRALETDPAEVETCLAWINSLQNIVSCPEQYGHKLKWRGGHPANHVANYIVPPELSSGERDRLKAADDAGHRELPWADYTEQVISPILDLDSLFYPELDYEMMNAYMVYDDGLEGGPGYNAVVGGVLAVDERRDVAIATIEGPGIEQLPVLPFADQLPRKGESVFALGSPLGLSFTATVGVISATRSAKELSEQLGGGDYDGTWIQIDAALSAGNSGGPIIDKRGQVVAMSTLASHGAQNLNFGISGVDVRRMLELVRTSSPKPLAETMEGLDSSSRAVAIASSVSKSTVAATEIRTWTDRTGQFSVEAAAVQVLGDDVALRRRDGKTVRVPIEKLSDADQQFLRQ